MPGGKIGCRLRRLILVALLGAGVAIAGGPVAHMAAVADGSGESVEQTAEDFSWGMSESADLPMLMLDFSWG
jgi:hypothetical protein